MPTSGPTRADAGRRPAGPGAPAAPREAGFTLIEMLVAMVLLSLVGLTLARFQSYQLAGASGLQLSAAARLEADNRAVDVLAAPAAPEAGLAGESRNAGRTWYWTATPAPSPDPARLPELVQVDIAVSLSPGGEPVARRSVVRSRGNPALAAGQVRP